MKNTAEFYTLKSKKSDQTMGSTSLYQESIMINVELGSRLWEVLIKLKDSNGNILEAIDDDFQIERNIDPYICLQFQQSSNDLDIVNISETTNNCFLSSDFQVSVYELSPVIQKDSDWNYNLIVSPTVQFIENKYFIWYNGNGLTHFQVGLTYSDDRYTWPNDESNPVLTIGNDGEFDSFNIRRPYVIYDERKFKMWYSGYGNVKPGKLYYSIGYAESYVGKFWSKHSNKPVIDVSQGGWDDIDVMLGSVAKKGNVYHLWCDGHSSSYPENNDSNHSNNIADGGYATSTDGINWTKDENNPIITFVSDGSWNQYSTAAGVFIHKGNDYMVWFSGIGGSTR